MRKLLFILFFTKAEQTAVLNALSRRQRDFSTCDINGDESIRNKCGKIAKELMS